MKVIDAHMHVVRWKEAITFARKQGINPSFAGFQDELTRNDIAGALVISGLLDVPTPIEYETLCGYAKKDERVFPICAVNPKKTTQQGFETFKKALARKEVYGIKIFLGYYPHYATDAKYARFYKLAQDYDCPVIFHTGDTFGEKFLLKYAHPLQIDEVAVRYPKTTFVIAHLGNPWIRDAAEVMYKNPNVFADVSAMCIGSHAKHPSTPHVLNDIDYAYHYVNDPSKFMFGSDWPLIPVKPYLDLMKKAVPKKHHAQFFYKNAKRLFHLPV